MRIKFGQAKCALLVGFALVGIFVITAVRPFRENSISIREIARIEDFQQFLDLSSTGVATVKSGEYQMICLTHGYGFALAQVKEIIDSKTTPFTSKVWAAAGGLNDYPEAEFNGAVVLLSAEKAVVLGVDKRNGISVGQRDCANVDSARVEIRKYGEHQELWLR